MVDRSDSCGGPMMIRRRGWWVKTVDGWFWSSQSPAQPEDYLAWGHVRLYRSDGSEFEVLPSEIVASESLWTYGVYSGVPFELTGIEDAHGLPVRRPVALSASDVMVRLVVYNEREWIEAAAKIPGVEVRYERNPGSYIEAVSLSVRPCELEEYRVRLRWSTGETT